MVFLQACYCAPHSFVIAKLLIFSKTLFLSRGRVLSRPEQKMCMHEIRVNLLTLRRVAVWGVTPGRNLKPYLIFLQGTFVGVAAAKAGLQDPCARNQSVTPGGSDSCT